MMSEPKAATFRTPSKVAAHQLFVEGKFLATKYTRILPYLSLGLGAAFNQAYGYRSYSNAPPFLSFTPAFANGSTQTSLIYLLGFGVDGVISHHLRAGIGYRFNNFGKVSLGQGLINETTIQTLTQSKLYAQSILFQLTYIV